MPDRRRDEGRSPDVIALKPALPDPVAEHSPRRSYHRRRAIAFLSFMALIVFAWWGSSYVFAYTDDAYVASDIVSVTPEVTGPIETVHVEDNGWVSKGTLLFTIDSLPFKLRVQQAEAEEAQARAQLPIDQAEVDSLTAQKQSADAAVDLATLNLNRATPLSQSRDISMQAFDNARIAREQSLAQQRSASAALNRAVQTAHLHQVTVASAHAATLLAQWRLSRTNVLAPVDGAVTHLVLRPGDNASPEHPAQGILPSSPARRPHRLGVVGHAAMAFLPGPHPGRGTRDQPRHVARLPRALCFSVAGLDPAATPGPGPYRTAQWPASRPDVHGCGRKGSGAVLTPGSGLPAPSLIRTLQVIPGALLRELRTLSLHGSAAREPAKAVLSVLLAVTAATLLQLDDLSWAAFSGYMVMRADVSEAIPRGLMRIAGTLGGAAVGVALAPGIADSPPLLIAAVFGASWVGTFGAMKSRYSYAWLFFGLTAGMVMIEALSSPSNVLHFAATRAGEIVVGTGSCFIVASLFAAAGAPEGTRAPRPETATSTGLPRLSSALNETWLADNWPLIGHSTRAAVAVASLPIIWRIFDIEDYAQTAVTSYVVMIVPAAVVHGRQHHALYERMAHRTLGCLLGSAVALAAIPMVGESLLMEAVVLATGVWIGYHVQNGREGVGYLGTQFALGLLITLVQGPGPITDITPGLERLLGIVIGSAALWLTIAVWPLPGDEPS